MVDGNIWTSSGVTAGASPGLFPQMLCAERLLDRSMMIIGLDMANAFLEFLAGKELAEVVRSRIELGVRNQEEDEFAEVHGLV